jgi:hypothetical protein
MHRKDTIAATRKAEYAAYRYGTDDRPKPSMPATAKRA